MQNRYAGDVGDFGKYGLLRGLCSPADGGLALRLGIVWYLVPDESHNQDGKHTGYLRPNSGNHRRFRACDPDLYDRLASYMTQQRRDIADVPTLGILPTNTAFYAEPLSFAGVPRPLRRSHRAQWAERAVHTVLGADLGFLDPDNGLEVVSTSPYADRGPKYVTPNEVRPYIKAGMSVIIYHHAGRNGTVEQQARVRADQLRAELGVEDVLTLRYRRGTTRLYFILPTRRHRDALQARVDTMLAGPWSAHFGTIT